MKGEHDLVLDLLIAAGAAFETIQDPELANHAATVAISIMLRQYDAALRPAAGGALVSAALKLLEHVEQ